MNPSRRHFLIGGLAMVGGALAYRGFRGLSPFHQSSYGKIPGTMKGATFARGHLLRNPFKKRKFEIKTTDTLIIGAGISGLSAAYHLKKNGIDDFRVIDLEDHWGGNSAYGKNKVGKHPFGAHYLPLVSNDSLEVKEFLKEIGVITNDDLSLPAYDPYMICSDLHERLFINGRWQEGLIPQLGLDEQSQIEIDRFFEMMEEYKKAYGEDGKKAFAIPLMRSSRDHKFRELDQITMKDFLLQQGFKSEYLHWYINYCCRDDYGAPSDRVSAWAGVHYFASRDGRGVDLDSSDVLTWPEGNGFLAKKLQSFVGEHIILNSLAYEIKEDNGLEILVHRFDREADDLYRVKNIIYASPLFSGKRIFKIPEIQETLSHIHVDSAPWMTANILLKGQLPKTSLSNAWDNVSYYSEGLGYVVSNHQEVSQFSDQTNITLYWPLLKENSTTKEARLEAIKKTHQDWCDFVIDDLEKTHPGIGREIVSIDVALFGHAMGIPEVGFLKQVNPLKKIHPHISFAHTDNIRISLFEEAFYQGLESAKRVLEARS